MAVDLAAARRAWATYAGTGARTRAFLAARLLVAPIGPLGPELHGLRGRVLSVGCGYGIVERYLTEINDEVTVDGVERDPQRVRVAEATRSRAPRLTVREGDAMEVGQAGGYDAALAIDLLHHVPSEQHGEVLARLERSLRPGGSCLVKDIATRPRWKFLWNRLHDRLAAGPEAIYCRSPEEMAQLSQAQGFGVDSVRRLSRVSPYPHYLLALRKPAPQGGSGGDQMSHG